MASPVATTYTVSTGTSAYGGRFKEKFDSVTVYSENVNEVPYNNPNQVMVVNFHGSGGANLVAGRQFRGACSGALAYSTFTEHAFSTVRISTSAFWLRGTDTFGTLPNASRREGMYLGFRGMPGTDVHLISWRRQDAMMTYALANVPNFNPNKICLNGNSMGGWGSMTYGIRRPHIFTSIYSIQPRWSNSGIAGKHMVAEWNAALANETIGGANSPNLAPEDGGGKFYDLQNCIAYVSNTANRLPWIGWCIGRQDGFALFQDQIDAVKALRKAKRGFCFVWNDGNHTTGSIISQITASYPYGTFELNKGYPLFTNHSGDQDPEVDLVGGINEGLSFRNVVETATTWSCEVTSIAGARTVDVEPISRVFITPVAAKTVVITGANVWASVSFSIV